MIHKHEVDVHLNPKNSTITCEKIILFRGPSENQTLFDCFATEVDINRIFFPQTIAISKPFENCGGLCEVYMDKVDVYIMTDDCYEPDSPLYSIKFDQEIPDSISFAFACIENFQFKDQKEYEYYDSCLAGGDWMYRDLPECIPDNICQLTSYNSSFIVESEDFWSENEVVVGGKINLRCGIPGEKPGDCVQGICLLNGTFTCDQPNCRTVMKTPIKFGGFVIFLIIISIFIIIIIIIIIIYLTKKRFKNIRRKNDLNTESTRKVAAEIVYERCSDGYTAVSRSENDDNYNLQLDCETAKYAKNNIYN